MTKEVSKKETIKPEIVNTVDKEKSDRSTQLLPRMAAYVFDMLIIAMLISLITSIKVLNPTYDKFVETTAKYSEYYSDYVNSNITINEFNKNTEDITSDLYKYGTSNYIIALAVIILYLGVFQKFNKGATIGKKIMKIRVSKIDGKEVSLPVYLLRIIPLFILSYGGVVSVIACIFLPYLLTGVVLAKSITFITIASCIIGLVDAEFAIARKDRRSLHDIICKTKIVNE